MKPPHLTSFCVALVGIFIAFAFHVNAYPSSMFTQQEIEDMEMEQEIQDDMDTLGYDRDFLIAFAKNLKKAIKEANDSRQLFQGGQFQGGQFQGGQGGNFGGGGNQGSFNGVNFGEEEEEDDETTGTTPQGPGALGILSGLYGIFSGIGSLNPDRVLASTVNFFPPANRQQAQNLIDQALYRPTPSTRAPPVAATKKPTGNSTNKNSSESASMESGSKDAFPELEFGPGSKPNANRRTRKTTKFTVSTTPFQDDEFDFEASKQRVNG